MSIILNIPAARRIDLHTHSSSSDGSDSPSELAKLAAESGLAAAALTDHDTISGVRDFCGAGAAYPDFEAIAGVEFSSRFSNREIHIVGLFIDPDCEALTELMAEACSARNDRNEMIRQRLSSLGYHFEWDELAPDGHSDVLGRPHFARALCEKYKFGSIAEGFERLLKRGAPAYVMRELPDPARVIETIRQSGGVAVWAHPIYHANGNHSATRRMVRRLAERGLQGIECYYSRFSPEQTAYLLKLAEEFRLAPSGGSDYHGRNIEHLAIGTGAGALFVPETILGALKACRGRA